MKAMSIATSIGRPSWFRARRSPAPTGSGQQRYEPGDVVRYSRGSKALGIEAGDYARVEGVDAKTNQITMRTDDDRALSYDPRRLQGVTLYRESERSFAAGDCVQMTAPDRERGVPNRELGTVGGIESNGRMEILWDSGRTSSFEAGERCHLDYGYALTSHNSQGQTAGRVLVHVETDRASALELGIGWSNRRILDSIHEVAGRFGRLGGDLSDCRGPLLERTLE